MSSLRIITLYIIIAYAFAVNINGPEQQSLITRCILDAVHKIQPVPSMVMVMVSSRAETPTYEIETAVAEGLSGLNISIQISDGQMHYFKSWKQCVNCNKPNTKKKIYKNYFQAAQEPDIYLIITNDIQILGDILNKIKAMKTYNLNAICFVFHTTSAGNSHAIIKSIMDMLYKYQFYKAVGVIRTKSDTLFSYTNDLYAAGVQQCMKKPALLHMNICKAGKFLHGQFLAREKFGHFNNCTVEVVAIKAPPFVVSPHVGLEMKILDAFAEQLEIKFNIKFINESIDWGKKLNGVWVGPLDIIYKDPFNVGLGGVTLTEERLEDFDFSDDYFTEKMVWIVPIALRVPQWKCIIIIFSYTIWASLLVILLGFGVLFYVSSRLNPRELNVYKMFGASMVLSLQVWIGLAAMNQPKTRVVRILFITYAIFNIIISCTYQSTLIDVLTNPRYEYQISSEADVFASGIGIGGISTYKEVFNEINDDRYLRIYNSYEIYADVNDTMYDWVLTVAQDRDTITILGQFYVQYLLANRDPGVTKRDHTPKVFIIPEILYTYPIRIVFSKGFPLKNAFNEVIEGLVHAGLFRKWHDKLLQPKHAHSANQSDGVVFEKDEALSLLHVEGAFFMLILGNIIGLVFFLLELVVSAVAHSIQYKKLRIKALLGVSFKSHKEIKMSYTKYKEDKNRTDTNNGK